MQTHLPELPIPSLPDTVRMAAPPSALARWQPHICASTDDRNADISILDTIGENFEGTGITSKRIAAALRQIGPNPVIVHINSPGGDFFEGVAIYNQLRAHPAPVTVHVLGLAASAASLIAMAGDTVHIGEGAFFMVHNAHSIAIGNRNDLRAFADMLEPFDQSMASIYAARSGQTTATVAKWMDTETWMDARTAIDCGLADEALPAPRIHSMSARLPQDDTRNQRSLALIESALAQAGNTRAERRAILKSVFSGSPESTSPGMPCAAVPVMPCADLSPLAALLQTQIQQLTRTSP